MGICGLGRGCVRVWEVENPHSEGRRAAELAADVLEPSGSTARAEGDCGRGPSRRWRLYLDSVRGKCVGWKGGGANYHSAS